jgi:carotenoid cleavage dioxygenase
MVIGVGGSPNLPMEGALPPDLQGTLLRIGPGAASGTTGAVADVGGVHGGRRVVDDPGDDDAQAEEAAERGVLHAVELRDGQAVSFLHHASDADANVFWHAGSVLALPETGLPSRYTRLLEPRAFTGALQVPIASHVHRSAADGGRILFAVQTVEEDGSEADAAGHWLRIGEWDAAGGLRRAQAVSLERATWQHDLGVTESHVVFIESPTRRLESLSAQGLSVPFGWVLGEPTWLGVVPRDGDGSAVRWFSIDPSLVTHVLGAHDEPEGEVVVYVCRYPVPEQGQVIDPSTPVVGPAGLGRVLIGGGLAVLERWRTSGRTLERVQLEDRHLEYPRADPLCEGAPFRYGYGVELEETGNVGEPVRSVGLLQFDLARDEVRSWSPGAHRRPSEPLFVRAADGRSDDEGWILTVVDDPDRGASDLYVLDASALGRRPPEAVIHLPARLPYRSHGEWVPADRYR